MMGIGSAHSVSQRFEDEASQPPTCVPNASGPEIYLFIQVFSASGICRRSSPLQAMAKLAGIVSTRRKHNDFFLQKGKINKPISGPALSGGAPGVIFNTSIRTL